MLKLPIYLDYNATTPCAPEVVEAMMPFFTDKFGNAASRNHHFGWQAEEAVKLAREQVAKLVNASPEEIFFTSGATEADNLAIKGVVERYRSKGNHIITCNTEHKAVLDTCLHLEKQGVEITYLKVNKEGEIDLQELDAAFKSTTILVAIMYANNETGKMMPVKEISRIARDKGVLFFSDATQAVGKITVDVNTDGIDLMAFSAHKMYGPKGIGALFVRRKTPGVKLTAQVDGGGHERGIRSGTLNVPGIVGFGKACESCSMNLEAEVVKISRLRDKLENALLLLDNTGVNGSRKYRLPNVSNIYFNYTDGDSLLMGITKNIAVSSGSACMSSLPEPSYVLKAMGLKEEQARSSLRFSLGRYTTEEEIDYTIDQVTTIVNKLQKLSPYQAS